MNHSRILVTGANGFIGTHFIRKLVDTNKVTALVWGDKSSLDFAKEKVKLIEFDCLDREATRRIVHEVEVDYTIHLAAQSSIPYSWKHPIETLQINILGTFNLLEALKDVRFRGRVLVVGAGAEYGYMGSDEKPIDEGRDFRPTSVYGVSKIAADMLGYLFAKNLGLNVIRVRPFNISGPGKIGDACSDFARGIVKIERGLSSELSVGNLTAIRDYLDVRDAVDGMILAVTKGEPGECYNICSGRGVKINDILQMMIGFSKVKVKVKRDRAKLRPVDEAVDIGSCDRLRALGWSPKVPIENMLSDTLDFWRCAPIEKL